MKHLISALCGLLLIFNSMAQNGGQSPENNSVKLEWSGVNAVKITNKQSCTSVIRVSYSNVTTDITILGNSYSILSVPTGTADVKAKSTTNCGGTDFGQVELTLQATPLKFVSYGFEPLGNNNVLASFETAETVNVKTFNILVSKDGVNYTTVGSIWADTVIPNRKYSIKVNCSVVNKQ